MSIKRIFIRESLSLSEGETFVPNVELQNHIFNVLRGELGEKFEFFTGKNISYFVEISNVKKREFYLKRVTKKVGIFKNRIVVLLPLMKGKKIKECSKKLVEVGVDEIVPIELERSVKKGVEKIEKKILTWVGEAAAQSGGIVPEIGDSLVGIDKIVSLYPDYKKIVFDLKNSIKISNVVFSESKKILVLTGPEGGFSEEERNKLKENKFISVKLNSNILRCETAPVVALSILREILED